MIEEVNLLHRLFHLRLIDQGIHRDIHSDIPDMAVLYRLEEFFMIKIAGEGAGREIRTAKIHGIASGTDRRGQRFHIPGRGKQFNLFPHSLLSSCSTQQDPFFSFGHWPHSWREVRYASYRS